MFCKYLTSLIAAWAAVHSVVARPALPVPSPGKYRIQNVGTGLYIDAEDSSQAQGTPVIVQTLNEPLTPNQEWTWSFDPTLGSPFGEFQSISSFVIIDFENPLYLILSPTEESVVTAIPVDGGVALCLDPQTAGCFTSPSTPVTQISIEPFTGALNQTWIFNSVGN